MRLSYPLLVELLSTHPNAVAATLESGLSPHEAARRVLALIAEAPNESARDAVAVPWLQALGINADSLAQFTAGSESELRRWAEASHHGREDLARTLSDQSRRTGNYSDPARIHRVMQAASQATLAQGLADRFRERDARDHERPAPIPARPELRHDTDDYRHRVASVIAAAHTTSDDWAPYRVSGRDDSVKGLLSEAFDAHDAERASADPLTDPGLMRATAAES